MSNSSVLGLRTCCYVVPDLEKAKDWYSRAFQTEPYFDQPFYVGFTIGGYELGLMPEEKAIGKRSANVLTYWGVEDIEKEYQRLLDMGAVVHENPENVGGEIVVGSVLDPWENVIGLIYNPDFKLP